MTFHGVTNLTSRMLDVLQFMETWNAMEQLQQNSPWPVIVRFQDQNLMFFSITVFRRYLTTKVHTYIDFNKIVMLTMRSISMGLSCLVTKMWAQKKLLNLKCCYITICIHLLQSRKQVIWLGFFLKYFVYIH